MPKFNGTGPRGMGPMTGRGLGPCGGGLGRGMGWGQCSCCPACGYWSQRKRMSKDEEKELLKEEAEELEEEMKAVREQLNELEQK